MCGKDQVPPKVPYRTQAFLMAGVLDSGNTAAEGEYVSEGFPITFEVRFPAKFPPAAALPNGVPHIMCV